MRIITGEFKGRKLETPPGNEVRPTSDKVKEAVFSIIMHHTPGAKVVDLFAGTGNLGLEALSRGAESCLFCDRERENVALIKRNIAHCGCEERSKVLCCDFMKALRSIDEKIDIFFIDPPYGAGLYVKALETIDILDLLAPEGIIIAEHERNTQIPETVGNIRVLDTRRYGKTMVTICGKM